MGTSGSVRRDSSRCTALATPTDPAPPPLPPGCLRTPQSLAGHSFGRTVEDQSKQKGHSGVEVNNGTQVVKRARDHEELRPRGGAIACTGLKPVGVMSEFHLAPTAPNLTKKKSVQQTWRTVARPPSPKPATILITCPNKIRTTRITTTHFHETRMYKC